jgi:hypothetical protein
MYQQGYLRHPQKSDKNYPIEQRSTTYTYSRFRRKEFVTKCFVAGIATARAWMPLLMKGR